MRGHNSASSSFGMSWLVCSKPATAVAASSSNLEDLGRRSLSSRGLAVPTHGVKYRFFSYLTLLVLLVALPAQATLLSADLFETNDGLLTIDTETGLEWLDITATRGQSYDSVASGYGGFMSLGFRFAVVSEVSELYSNAGVIYQQGGYYAENAAGAALLISLIGCTINCNFSVATQQGLADSDPFSRTLARAPYVAISSDRTLGFANLLAATIAKNRGYQEVGSYLVRPIPEPSTATFLSIGFSVLALTRPKYSGCPLVKFVRGVN